MCKWCSDCDTLDGGVDSEGIYLDACQYTGVDGAEVQADHLESKILTSRNLFLSLGMPQAPPFVYHTLKASCIVGTRPKPVRGGREKGIPHGDKSARKKLQEAPYKERGRGVLECNAFSVFRKGDKQDWTELSGFQNASF
uniref:Uncharacterized protein n=1 Tax=Eutreptiella gymnastica TaxID=73025 RepID=A0A6U7XSR8_9EUGL|mmetsp:Transcript_14117/g.25190  ORF Transcript_14117/g.25190 Transcript_14117/m.25190 type:complete len:140 (+) Transcript_14117:674-1093(+)